MSDLVRKSTNATSWLNNVTFSTASLDIEESIEQMTLPAAVDMAEGSPVYVDANGKFTPSDGSASGTAHFYGLTTRKVKAGQAVTAIAKGVVGGFDLSGLAYGASVYVSDTDGGNLGTAAGTVSVKVGEVIPVWGQTRGTAPAKLLRVMG